MMERSKYVLSPWFIGALTLLICNDLWWKASYSNALTGKLSDLSGVLVLGLLFNLISDRNRKLNALFVVVFFTFWKSPLSEGLIVAWNSLPVFNVERVVDYSDLIAFIGLPVITHVRFAALNKPSPWLFGTLLGFAFFALTSTSRTRDYISGWDFNEKTLQFQIQTSENELLNYLEKELSMTHYKTDTIYFDQDLASRYFLAAPTSDSRTIVDSCEIWMHPKNAKTLYVDIVNVHFVPKLDLQDFATLNDLQSNYLIKKVKFVERAHIFPQN